VGGDSPADRTPPRAAPAPANRDPRETSR
jgi:hypothetical protein